MLLSLSNSISQNLEKSATVRGNHAKHINILGTYQRIKKRRFFSTQVLMNITREALSAAKS